MHVTTVPSYCRDTIAARDRSVAERDTNNAGLQRQIEALTDRLKVLYTVLYWLTSRYASLISRPHPTFCRLLQAMENWVGPGNEATASMD